MTIFRKTDINFASELDFSQILTNPILDIAARFWEKDRYEAFRICYRSMRRIDDLVDDRRTTMEPISDDEAREYREKILDWLGELRNRQTEDHFSLKLLGILDRFAIPLWPWEHLCNSMIFDLQNDFFESFSGFIRYAAGAAVAPASVFMHLCGVNDINGEYVPPPYHIGKTARPLAIFSYLVHIIRDFQKDQLRHLNYFPADLLKSQSLETDDLRLIARTGRIPPTFRHLVEQYVRFGDYYRRKARLMIDRISPSLTPRYRLSLEVIYGLYHLIFERIDPQQGTFTENELTPSPSQIQARIESILADHGPLATQ